MARFIFFLIFGALLIFGLSYYKNEKISQKISHIDKLDQDGVKCSGLIDTDCSIKNPAYNGLEFCDELIIKDIDLLNAPKNGEFKDIPIKLELKNVKYSLWDFLVKYKSSSDLKEFFKKYKKDYDIDANLVVNSNAKEIKNLKIINLKADDKFIPFELSSDLNGIDKEIKIKKLNITFDFSKKREIFNDFVDSMKRCCADSFDPKYQKMSKDELYELFKSELNSIDMPINSLTQVAKVLTDDKKQKLTINLTSKTNTPISKMLLPFLMIGPNVVDNFFDIKVEAK